MLGATETPSRIEPCFLEQMGPELVDLIAELSAEAERLGRKLHHRTAASLADIVRIMNCYYSNLIEGHNTTPRDIEKALGGQLESEEERRNLQLEAKAHIRVQEEVDRMYAKGVLPEPASAEFIRWLHREFYRDAPEAMLLIKGAGREFIMQPGTFRSLPEHEVTVGRHVPPSSDRIEAFMSYFEKRFRLEGKGKSTHILAMATAHHRLNYIHPFPDGNGRVSRLMSHAMALWAGIGAHSLWSVSRGLARGISSSRDYKERMDHADTPRQGDLDGRGNLSLSALTTFVLWFLGVCLDQIRFMNRMFDLEELGERLKLYAQREGFKPEAFYLLQAVLLRDELPRGEAERVTGLKERTARMVLSNLIEDGILGSDTPKGPVSLRFPVKSVEVLFPHLFPPETTADRAR
jgi:Fic family protein